MTGAEFDAFFLADWWGFLTRVLTGGIARYESKEYGDIARKDHRHCTRCQARHDHFIAIGKEEMLRLGGIRYYDLDTKDLFIFGDRVGISFNLLGKNHLPRLNKTSQSRGLQNQRLLLKAEDLPPELVYLIAGYTVDRFGNPKELWLTCPDGLRRNRWERRLSSPPMENMLDTLPPSVPKPPSLPPLRVRKSAEEIARDEEKQHESDDSVEQGS